MKKQSELSMPTIAIDATYVVDPQPSGISIYSRKLIEALAELDTRYRFLIGYRISRWRSRRQFVRLPERPAGHQFENCFFQEPWTFWLPYRVDLFHSLAQRPAPFRFRREIVTIHDVFPLTGRDYSTPAFQRKFSAFLVEAAARAARVIVPSQYSADQLCEHAGVEQGKIRVIPEGVSAVERFLMRDELIRVREAWVGRGNEMVLVVGVIQTRKNTLGALHALERLPANYRMVLVGGTGHGCGPIFDYLRQSGLGDRTVIAGHVDSRTLSSLYQAASVLLFPSFEEGFGLPVLEAMAYGLPVVASNASSLAEVGGEAALYADPCDEKALANQVRRAVEEPEVRKRAIAAGLARSRGFSWRRTAEMTLAVYEEVL